MQTKSTDPIEIEVTVIKQHGKSVSVSDGTIKVLIPFNMLLEGSTIDSESPVGFEGVIRMLEWKAEELGLI